MFSVAAKTESDARQWVHDYQEMTKCSYWIRSTKKCAGQKVEFKQLLRCQRNTGCRNTYDPLVSKRTRNTDCPSSISITLRKVHKYYRGKDKTKAPDPEMPCEIKLIPCHNHSVLSADTSRFRPVCDDTKQKLINLFESGHSPATALECIKMDIQFKFDNFNEVLADRSLCPGYMYCYHLYKSLFKKKYDPLQVSREALEKKVEEYNRDNENSARIKFIAEEYVIW